MSWSSKTNHGQTVSPVTLNEHSCNPPGGPAHSSYSCCCCFCKWIQITHRPSRPASVASGLLVRLTCRRSCGIQVCPCSFALSHGDNRGWHCHLTPSGIVVSSAVTILGHVLCTLHQSLLESCVLCFGLLACLPKIDQPVLQGA